FQLINQGCFDISFLRRKNRPWKPIFRPRLGVALRKTTQMLSISRVEDAEMKEAFFRQLPWKIVSK
ncbi:MAG: hypothetical protein KH897_11040, partial [Bacteroides sp.]|uniref:hypothetical protein n=1 Tax=Bacteroides sp. TaxID=29523 RepID=UPI0025C2ABBB